MVAEAASSQHEGNLLASQEDGPSLETVLKQAKHQSIKLASNTPEASNTVEKNAPDMVSSKVKNKKVHKKTNKSHKMKKPAGKSTVTPAKKTMTHKAASKTVKNTKSKPVSAKTSKQSTVKKVNTSKHPKQSLTAKGSHHLQLGVAEDYSTYVQSTGHPLKTKSLTKPGTKSQNGHHTIQATASHSTHHAKNVHLTNAKLHHSHTAHQKVTETE